MARIMNNDVYRGERICSVRNLEKSDKNVVNRQHRASGKSQGKNNDFSF